MDQDPITQPMPDAWTEALAQGRADVAAGRVTMIDTEALCREIEAEANAPERDKAARHASDR